LINSQLLYR